MAILQKSMLFDNEQKHVHGLLRGPPTPQKNRETNEPVPNGGKSHDG